MKFYHLLATVCAAGLIGSLAVGVNAQTGGAQPQHRPHMGMPHMGGSFGHHPMMQGRIIGNKQSHVYHLPGDKGSLPAPKNRVYFMTEAQARAAGYHRAGMKGGNKMTPAHHGMMGHGMMGHSSSTH